MPLDIPTDIYPNRLVIRNTTQMLTLKISLVYTMIIRFQGIMSHITRNKTKNKKSKKTTTQK